MQLVLPLLFIGACWGESGQQLGSIAFFKRASEQLALGHDIQALGDFRKAVAADPSFKPAQYNLANTYLRLGLIDQAVNASSPDVCTDDRCRVVAAKAHEFLNFAAEQQLEEDNDCNLYAAMLELAPKSVSTLKAEAQCFFARGRPIDAIRDLTQVVQIDRSDSEAAARAAVGSFVLLGQQQQAMQVLRQCVSFDDEATACKTATKQLRKLQKSVDGQPIQKIKVNDVIKQTRALLKQYNIPQAGTEAGAGSVDDGLLVDKIRRGRCEFFAEREMFDRAGKVCAQARDLDPDFPAALLVQAHLEREQGNNNQALDIASKLLKEAQNSPDRISQTIAQLARQLHDEIIMERRQPRQPQQQPDKDLYGVLGVDTKADKREIRRAYRQLSKTYHPDKYKGKDMSEDEIMAKMQEINEAYEILSDDDKRRDYDDQRSGGFNGGNAGFGNGFDNGFGGAGAGFGGFDHIFQNMQFNFRQG